MLVISVDSNLMTIFSYSQYPLLYPKRIFIFVIHFLSCIIKSFILIWFHYFKHIPIISPFPVILCYTMLYIVVKLTFLKPLELQNKVNGILIEIKAAEENDSFGHNTASCWVQEKAGFQ